MVLTVDQVQIIRSTVPVLREHGTAITTLFYSTLLDENPTLSYIFNQTNQANGHQAAALAGALYAYASNIDNLGVLSPTIEKMCQKHASLHIQPEHYDVVGHYLLRAMGDVLGAALTPAILQAWGAAYWQLANLMMKRESQLYSQRDGWTGWRDFEIADKVQESASITSFYLKPLDERILPPFRPGQYISVMINVPVLQYEQSRQYSLSDAPRADYYRISVKREPGLDHNDPAATAHPGCISNILHREKEIGDVLKLGHPSGEFFLNQHEDGTAPVVLLSAGVGITPMMSILNALLRADSNRRISFVHGAHNSNTRAFSAYLHEIAVKRPNVTYTSFIKAPVSGTDIESSHCHHAGRIDLDKIRDELCLDNSETQYFICGPDSFMADVERKLMDFGIVEERIKVEKFGTGAISKS